jgi:acyl-CoA thioesterase-2
MPQVPEPETLTDLAALPNETVKRLPPAMRRYYERAQPFEFRLCEPDDLLEARNAPPLQHVWIRAVDRLPDDDALHRCLFAYVSDFHLLNAAARPHAQSFLSGTVLRASIDHAMWFHRPMRVDEWLLYAIDSPSASGARGFARGSVFMRDGRLVGSTAQEGLLRVLEPRDSGH